MGDCSPNPPPYDRRPCPDVQIQAIAPRLRCVNAGLRSERPVRVLDVDARPSPVRTPGRVKLSALVNVTADLPTTLNADVLVSKAVLGLHLKIPCYRNVGSWYVRRTPAVKPAFHRTSLSDHVVSAGWIDFGLIKMYLMIILQIFIESETALL